MNEAFQSDDPDFTIRTDASRGFIDIKMRGYWNAATIDRFERQVRREVGILVAGGWPIDKQVTIIDTTGYQVQSQQAISRLGQVATDPDFRSLRTAMVMSSALMKLQAKRVSPLFRFFDDRDKAMTWLFEPRD